MRDKLNPALTGRGEGNINKIIMKQYRDTRDNKIYDFISYSEEDKKYKMGTINGYLRYVSEEIFNKYYVLIQ